MIIMVIGSQSFQKNFAALLSECDFSFERVETAETEAAAMERLNQADPKIIVISTGCHGVNSVELIKKICQRDPLAQVLLCGKLPSIAFAISALNSGASYFLLEPIDHRNLNAALKKALRPLERCAQEEESFISARPSDTALFGMQQALSEIEAHLEQDYSLERAAALANMSVSYFCAQFRREKGMSYKEYMIRLRISTAKKLLKNTDRSVNNIAEAVGYNNPNYFSKVFREREGMTPSEFRHATP